MPENSPHTARPAARRSIGRAFAAGATVALLCWSAVGILLAALGHLQTTRGTEKFEALARVLAHNSVASLEFRDSLVAAEVLQSLSAETEVEAAFLYDGNNALFAQFQRTAESPISAPAIQPTGCRVEAGRLICLQTVKPDDPSLGTICIVSTPRVTTIFPRQLIAVAGTLLIGLFLGLAAGLIMLL